MTEVPKMQTRKLDSPNKEDANGLETSGRGRIRLAPGLAVAAAILCILVMGGTRLVRAQAYTVIYSFNGSPSDGAGPSAGVIRDSAGNLYGTTTNGGSAGDGTVYKLDPSGGEIVLHSFAGGNDGSEPLYAGVVRDAAGNLYGTTLSGGPLSGGTVYKVNPSGNETVLHAFSFNNIDGSLPVASLVMDSSGNLYGTTDGGGPGNNGTVFKVDSSGNETVLHSFTFADGAHPEAPVLRDSAGNLYGTTRDGGSGNNGTVFKVDPSGNETVLYSFTGGSDGGAPEGGVIMDSAGSLYGTTSEGGSSGDGTVFKLDPSGKETVLHSFVSGEGSPYETELVMDSAGNLYGTTPTGGSSSDGTLFKVAPSGNETILHSFTNSGGDGAYPYTSLILDSGNLYGTTSEGGSSGNGTVFRFALPVPFSAFGAKLDISSGGFQLNANFTQGSGAPAIDPLTQAVTLNVGSYTVTIPAGSFQKIATGRWVYDGTISGATLDVQLSQTGTNSYSFHVDSSGVDLTKQTNPVAVSLTIGQNSGTTQVTAGF